MKYNLKLSKELKSLQKIEGIVEKAFALKFRDGRISTLIELKGQSECYQLIDQSARIDREEKVRIYTDGNTVGASERIFVDAIEILDNIGKVKFTYLWDATKLNYKDDQNE